MHGLDTYDYGARGYYPTMGRFMTVDPLAEKYYSISPYAYCAGNPVNTIDPNGMDLLKVNVPYNINGSKTKVILVDSKAASQVFNFALAMYSQYGLIVISAYRTKEYQLNMRHRWDTGDRRGLKYRPALKSSHSAGFALDFNVKYFNKTQMDELTNIAKEYGFYYGGTSFKKPDIVHFYLDETDYGYESRDEATEVNDKYIKKNGNNIPTYSNENSQETQNDISVDNDETKSHLNAIEYQNYFMKMEDKNKARMKSFQDQIDSVLGNNK